MYKVLERMCSEQKLCELYSDISDAGCCGVGYIVDYDDDFFVVEAVSPEGRHDGFYCCLIEDLFKIEADTNYLKNIKKLMPFYSFSRKDIEFVGENILEQMLNHIEKTGKICQIEVLNESKVFGTIKELTEDTVTISRLDQYGVSDGESFIRVGDITCVAFGSEDEIKLEILSK